MVLHVGPKSEKVQVSTSSLRFTYGIELFSCFARCPKYKRNSRHLINPGRGYAMSAVGFIRRFIFSLPEGEMFTTRDCLGFGFRSAVDRALSRLVRNGTLRRLARGVFARDPDGLRHYSDYEIAKIKAESFGRKLAKHPLLIASELGLEDVERVESTFSTDGHTTKFHAGKRTIRLMHSSSRKMKLSNSKTGQAARALWYLGKYAVNPEMIMQAVLKFDREDRLELKRNVRWMPAWLADSFKFSRRWDLAQAG